MYTKKLIIKKKKKSRDRKDISNVNIIIEVIIIECFIDIRRVLRAMYM